MARVGAPLLATLLLALLDCSRAISPLPHCLNTSEDDATATRPSCTLLTERYRQRDVGVGWRGVSVDGRDARVLLYWGSAPARAAAALLRATLTYALHYRRVRTACGPHLTADLAKHVPFYAAANYTDLVIGVSTAWKGETDIMPVWLPGKGKRSGLAGPRLIEFGFSSVPAHCRLHARLAPAARSLPTCQQHVRWTFYADATALTHCGFEHFGGSSSAPVVAVLVTGNCDVALTQLLARTTAAALPLRVHCEPRAVLTRLLRTANHSFLFLDYDIWEGESNVSFVEPPPCVSVNSTCRQDLDSAIAMRVADVELLQNYAPQLFHFVYDFKPSSESLRLILEREANGVDIEESVCDWALKHESELRSWDLPKYTKYSYWIAVYLCDNDPDLKSYDRILSIWGEEIWKQSRTRYTLLIRRFHYNCSDAQSLSTQMLKRKMYVDVFSLVGVVAIAGAGAADAARAATALTAPLLLAGAAPEHLAPLAWRLDGSARHVALALHRFMLAAGWTRLAVLSQPTALAVDYYGAIQEEAHFALRNYNVPHTLTKQQAIKTLQKIQTANARIVFVNADTEAAVAILSAAVELRMSYADGFVWIVRDWRPHNATSNMTHFTVSFWSRGEQDLPSTSDRRNLLNMLPDHWPPHAAALSDALLTLAHGFNELFTRYPSTRQDLRNTLVTKLLKEILITTPVRGLTQYLHFKEQSIEETFVFVDEWRGTTFSRLATWRVNATAHGTAAVRGNYTPPSSLPSYDGASRCLARTGDAFEPECYDMLASSALLVLVLASATVLLAPRLLRQRLARLVARSEVQLLARRQRVANVLAAYLVKRDTLELQEELGAGSFGCVRLALLRAPSAPPRYVAAKALRANAAPAEESEFLREACTIASLEHKHVVRLVGVCVEDGPPLVLMELAFFGDLLGYLRARRHLVESCEPGEPASTSEEAVHVSGEALTRLAREAAAALAYLSSRSVVHRDVRAANCLVDVRRSLKLADFGMARETAAGEDGAPEYACRRRGLFPVLWMAPESLTYGVFSAASDVWALGVLMLEVVTLGARPYGSMSPLQVLEYVAAGGRPPLPLDVTPHTRELVRLCWQRCPERRPSAAEVAVFLEAQPRALQPALLAPREEPADADSGYGESPSTELLPPDSPLDSLALIRLNVMDATH